MATHIFIFTTRPQLGQVYGSAGLRSWWWYSLVHNFRRSCSIRNLFKALRRVNVKHLRVCCTFQEARDRHSAGGRDISRVGSLRDALDGVSLLTSCDGFTQLIGHRILRLQHLSAMEALISSPYTSAASAHRVGGRESSSTSCLVATSAQASATLMSRATSDIALRNLSHS